MDDRRVFWAVVGTVLLVVAVVFFSDRVQRELRPDPHRAFIAFEVDDEGVARPGPIEVKAGTRFEVHAVLEARGLGGRRVYFTRAPGLEIDGETIPTEELRPWNGPEEAKVLWFSVEGPRPFVRMTDEQSTSEVPFQAIFRSEWPRAWSIPGSVRPAREASALRDGAPLEHESFGTQRYRVRIELFGLSSTLVPVSTFESTAPDRVISESTRFPTVVATLPGTLALPSRVFGLTQLEMTKIAFEREAAGLLELYDHDLAYSRLVLLRAMFAQAGISFEAVDWQSVDLAAGPPWGLGGAEAGDLLRAGDRVVVLYQDRGVAGRLDYEDLCMDFSEGARVLPLRDVFVGEGLVERADLTSG